MSTRPRPGYPPGRTPTAPETPSVPIRKVTVSTPTVPPDYPAHTVATASGSGPQVDLLDQYESTTFLLASGDRILNARGCEPSDAHAGAPMLVGALPFEPDEPAHLMAPRSVRRADRASISPVPGPIPPVTGEWTLRPHPSTTEFTRAVSRSLNLVEHRDLEKVVLSRSLRLETTGRVDRPGLLRALLNRDPRSYAFSVPLPEDEGHPVFLGATPELLVRKAGEVIVSHPLAGSRPRGIDVEQDRANAAELLASSKDRHEHSLVVSAVADALRPFCRSLDVPSTPSILDTPTMWHLGTRIEGRLLDPEVSSMTLARALHPTPAICGTPTEKARSAIAELESESRGFYTGAVGWTDWTGDGEWVVAIRCAEVRDNSARLHAGAGIVPGSTPEDELAETSAKFRTLLAALGLEEG